MADSEDVPKDIPRRTTRLSLCVEMDWGGDIRWDLLVGDPGALPVTTHARVMEELEDSLWGMHERE